MNWNDYLPETGLRPAQTEALDGVWEAFERGAEVVMLEAPTGVGKSIIELVIARRMLAEGMGQSFIVTPQRALQNDFLKWSDVAVMKGRGSYQCALLDDGTSAAQAPCTTDQSVRENELCCSNSKCPFYSALGRAVGNSITIHNYASLLAQSYMVQHFSRRYLLAMDEGHTAAGWVRNFATFEFRPDQLAELGGPGPTAKPKNVMTWFLETVGDMDVVPQGLSDELKMSMLRAMAFRSLLPSSSDAPSEIPWTANSDGRGTWSILPLKVSKLSRILTTMGERKLIVTATVLDTRLMVAELGLAQSKHELIRINSAFPVENRPIVKRYAGAMTTRNRRQTFPKMIDALLKIAESHAREPGLVHTVSHLLSADIVKEIRPKLFGRTVEMLPQGGDRDAVISAFLRGALGPNAILVGPGMLEGIDGKDDSCRWQAMAKVPFPNMGDPVVSAQMASTGQAKKWADAWYSWKTAQQAVQGFGRVVRGPTDHGVTYLLDSSFDRVLASGFIPRYVLDAVSDPKRGSR